MRGAAWTVGGYGASQVLRLGSNLVLTRLLFPEAFGLMALVYAFTQGLQMFSDLGLGPAVIRDRRGDDPTFINTAWTVQVIRGFVLWGCSWLLAGFIAQLFGEPMLARLLPVVGFTAVISGFNATAIFTAKRKLRLGRLSVLELSSQVTAISVMIAWALLSPSVWALVGGALVGAFVRMVGSHVFLHGVRPAFELRRDAAQALLRFGKWIFLSSAVYFAAQQGDRFFLARYVPIGVVGVYAIAVNIGQILQNTASRLSGQVLYPALSNLGRQHPGRLASGYYRARRHLDVALIGAGIVIVAGPPLIAFLYDDRYAAAGWMLQLLGLRAAMACVNVPAANCLVSQGHPHYAFLREAAKAGVMLVGLPAGWYFGGLHGLVWAAGLVEVPALVILWYGMARLRLLRPRGELLGLVYLAAGILGGFLIRLAVTA